MLFAGLLAGPVITDGAWGTELQARGLALGECPDAWNLSYPDRVEAVARSYVEAGSQVILTNTFGANRIRLEPHGLAERVSEVNRAGVRISRRAAAGRGRVFASIGPTGKMVASGDISSAELGTIYEEQARALAAEGVDALVLETFSELAELLPALAAAKATGLPVVACMVFDSGAARDRTMTGTKPEQAAQALVGAGADAVGANCGRGIEGHVEICRRFRASTDRPLWLKPNAGLPEIEGDRAVYRTTPEAFAAGSTGLVQAGATFVGGCCGTSPAFVAAIVERLASVGADTHD